MDPAPLLINKLIRSRRRTIGLTVTEDAQVIVRAPLKASMKAIDDFVTRHERWLQKTKQDVLKRFSEKPRHTFRAGEALMVLGRLRVLTESRAHKKPELAEDLLILPHTHRKPRERLVEELLRQEALKWITPRAAHFAAKTGKPFKRIRITGAQTRWGSCGPDASLHFSWRLFLAPPEIVDYVVAHEVAHLKHRNHGPHFWALVEKLDPAFQKHRRWLVEHGHKLAL